jgi:hypothetical protein
MGRPHLLKNQFQTVAVEVMRKLEELKNEVFFVISCHA